MIDIPQGIPLLSLFSNILFSYVQMNDVFPFISKSLPNAKQLNVKSTFSVKTVFFPVFLLFLVVFCVSFVCIYVYIVYFIYANKNIKTENRFLSL